MGTSRGWSITVGELRAALEGVPDDYEVMLENAEVDDCEISNVNIRMLIPPATTESGECEIYDSGWCGAHSTWDHEGRPHVNSPGLLVLGGGQILNSEYGYLPRLDAWLEQEAGHWKNVPLHDHQWGWTT